MRGLGLRSSKVGWSQDPVQGVGGGSLNSKVQVEQVWTCLSWGEGPCTVRSKMNKLEQVWGTGALYRGGAGPGPCSEGAWLWSWTGTPSPCKQNDRKTQLKTLPSRNFVGQR